MAPRAPVPVDRIIRAIHVIRGHRVMLDADLARLVVNALIEGDLPGGYDLVVMANLDPPAAEQVARMVSGWLGARDEGRVIRRRPGA